MTSLRLSVLQRVKETSLSYCKSVVADTVPRSRDHQIPRTHLSHAYTNTIQDVNLQNTVHRNCCSLLSSPWFSFHVSSGCRFSFRTLELRDTTGTLKQATTVAFHIHAVPWIIRIIIYATHRCVISAVYSRWNNQPRRIWERERESWQLPFAEEWKCRHKTLIKPAGRRTTIQGI